MPTASHLLTSILLLPNLRLQAFFTNGDMRLYDVAPLQARWPVFQSLSAIPGLFALARIDCGGHGVVWNDEIDLDSEEIWHNGTPL
jgi:hypothetical protein